MRKGAPHARLFALIAVVLFLLAACTAPAATPGDSTQPQTAAAVPTAEATLAPDAPCRDCWPGPYHMFTSAAAMRQAIAAHGADTPQQIPSWGFLAATDHAPTIAGMAGGVAATELTIPYRDDISLVKYQYDPQTRTYARFQNNVGKAVRDVDAVNNQPIAASNVAIIHTEIWEV